jgi:hypothetical protein
MSRSNDLAILIKEPGNKVSMWNCSTTAPSMWKNIKEMLQNVYKIPKQHLRLVHAGKQFSNMRTLRDYCFSDVTDLYFGVGYQRRRG